MAWSPEHRNNNPLVERKKSPGEQLELQFRAAQKNEVSRWQELFKGVKNLDISDWAKLVTAGVLIGTAWYLKGHQKVGDWLELGGNKLLREALRKAWRGIRQK